MATRIAAQPIGSELGIAGFRSRSPQLESRSTEDAPASTDLPPPASPLVAPATPPPLESPDDTFAAALAAERMPSPPATSDELRLRRRPAWTAPDSPLRLTDRTA